MDGGNERKEGGMASKDSLKKKERGKSILTYLFLLSVSFFLSSSEKEKEQIVRILLSSVHTTGSLFSSFLS